MTGRRAVRNSLEAVNVFIFKHEVDLSFIQVSPGEHVVLKPNLVKEHNLADRNEWGSVITSRETITMVCEHVARQLGEHGRITICDAPQTDSSFSKIERLLDLHGLCNRLTAEYGLPVEVLDLRNEEWRNEEEVIIERRKLKGDPAGTVSFNLGRDSLFYKCKGEGRYYGADYDSAVVNQHHQGTTQEYLICRTPIEADVFINLPKLKTHKKTGVTLNLKNLVGINADKNWLPHHTDGSPSQGGDQFPDLTLRRRCEQTAVRCARQVALRVPGIGTWLTQRMRQAGKIAFGDTRHVIRSGNWHGNDTTWRMVLDLNRCLLFGNADGTFRRNRPKRYYSLIDGRIGMEGNGPMEGTPIHSGVMIGGTDPVAVDMVAARVMGFDWRRIPTIREAFGLKSFPITQLQPEDVEIVSDVPDWNGRFIEIENREFLSFRPHFGWVGQIEYVKRV